MCTCLALPFICFPPVFEAPRKYVIRFWPLMHSKIPTILLKLWKKLKEWGWHPRECQPLLWSKLAYPHTPRPAGGFHSHTMKQGTTQQHTHSFQERRLTDWARVCSTLLYSQPCSVCLPYRLISPTSHSQWLGLWQGLLVTVKRWAVVLKGLYKALPCQAVRLSGRFHCSKYSLLVTKMISLSDRDF